MPTAALFSSHAETEFGARNIFCLSERIFFTVEAVAIRCIDFLKIVQAEASLYDGADHV
jgi:hypothetical protein